MTWEWWAAFIGGPAGGPFLVRRAWWWLCVGAGWVDDWRSERDMSDDKEAFANGRSVVISTGRHLINLQLSKVDWRGLALGLVLSLKHFRAVCAMTWAGVKRDARVFCRWLILSFHDLRVDITHKAPSPISEPELTQRVVTLDQVRPALGLDDGEAGRVTAGTLQDLHARARTVRRDIMNKRDIDWNTAINEHVWLRGVMKRELADVPAPLLGPVGALASGLSWKLTAASAGLAVLFFGLWRHDEGALTRVKGERDTANANLTAVADNRQKWVDYAAGLRGQITQASASTKATTATIEAERARARVAEARKRKTDDAIKAAAAGGPPPAWDSLLNDEAVTDAGQPADSVGGNPDPSGGVRPVADHTDAAGPT